MKWSEWRFSMEIAWDDPWARRQTMLTLLAFAIVTGLFLYKLIPAGLESSLLVFHYNPYLGIDEIQHWMWMFAYVGGAWFVVLADIFLSFQLFRHDRIASRVLLCLSTVFAALLAVAGHFIASINV